jgi:hypothetical protein
MRRKYAGEAKYRKHAGAFPLECRTAMSARPVGIMIANKAA